MYTLICIILIALILILVAIADYHMTKQDKEWMSESRDKKHNRK